MTQPPNPSRPAMTEAEREAMVALAERCEAATRPDRELDDAIATVVFRYSGMSQLVGVADEQQFRTFTYANGSIGSSLRYTASLDAAMTLVPENADAAGERFRLEAYNSPGVLPAHVRASAWVAGAARVYAVTPALALTAAALRARANQGTPA